MNRKVFDLKAALKAESLAPIPMDHAATVSAVLEALDIPVTAGSEATIKITELNDSVNQIEGDLKALKKGVGNRAITCRQQA